MKTAFKMRVKRKKMQVIDWFFSYLYPGRGLRFRSWNRESNSFVLAMKERILQSMRKESKGEGGERKREKLFNRVI